MKKKLNLKALLIHRNIYTNSIAYNPLKLDSENITLKELARIYNYRFKVKKFKRELQNLQHEGQPVFKFIHNGNSDLNSTIIVNPYLYKPMDNSSDDLLKLLFQ